MKKLLLVLSSLCVGDMFAGKKRWSLSQTQNQNNDWVQSRNQAPEQVKTNREIVDVYEKQEQQEIIQASNDHWVSQLEKDKSLVEQEVSTYPYSEDDEVYPYSEGDAVYTESEWNVWDNIIKPYFKKSEPAKSENVSSESAVQSVAAESVVQEIAQPVAETKAQADVCLKQSNTQHVVGGAIAATIVVYSTYKIVKYAFAKWKNYAVKKQFVNQ